MSDFLVIVGFLLAIAVAAVLVFALHVVLLPVFILLALVQLIRSIRGA